MRTISVLFCLLAGSVLRSAGAPEITVHDDRLTLSVMAEAPDLVTPIGVAAGPSGRLYVVESHTYTPDPSDSSDGPTDRIRMIVDRDGDGRYERLETAFEGLDRAMNLAFSPNGPLYVACAKEVVALLDHNEDGIFDAKRTVLTLETDYAHPHYGLTGIAFDPDGMLYVSRGNVGGHAFTVRGADGSAVTGYGDGGDVIRCTPGGHQVERFATGFWNAFALHVDRAHRLLAADSDPEAIAPNRLLHVVRGGDYGLRSIFVGREYESLGSWNGEFPGTLPVASVTREAPSGILDCDQTALPVDYLHNLLITSWGESRIERHQRTPGNLSFNAFSSILISGDQDFRPVAITADAKGVIYFTDWASGQYANHGGGRLWRLAVKSNGDVERLSPRDTPLPDADPIEEIASTRAVIEVPKLLRILTSGDAFGRHAAVSALSQPVFWGKLHELAEDANPAVRLGALLAFRQGGHPDAVNLVTNFLRDPSEWVRRSALQWAAMLHDPALRPALELAINEPDVSSKLLETYLAARAYTDPEFADAYRNRSTPSARDLPRPAEREPLEAIIKSEATSDALRMVALMRLGKSPHPENLALLEPWLASSSSGVRLAAVLGIGSLQQNTEEAAELLKDLAVDENQPADLRSEAIAAYHRLRPFTLSWMADLLDDPSASVRMATARAMRSAPHDGPERAALAEAYDEVEESAGAEELAEQLAFALYGLDEKENPFSRSRPDSVDAWISRLGEGGDPAAGRRVFFTPELLCAQCHTPDAIQSRLGPSLYNVGLSVDRPRLIRSILRPSADAAPHFKTWMVITRDGETQLGIRLERLSDGSMTLLGLDNQTVRFEPGEVVSYRDAEHSLMPEGFQMMMTVSEMRDLVAYLDSLGGGEGLD